MPIRKLLAFFLPPFTVRNLLMPKNEPIGTEVSFETAMERLEKIVQEMESSKLPLEDLLVRYEEGIRLVGVCNQRLAGAENRIEILAGRLMEDRRPLVPRTLKIRSRTQTKSRMKKSDFFEAPAETRLLDSINSPSDLRRLEEGKGSLNLHRRSGTNLSRFFRRSADISDLTSAS